MAVIKNLGIGIIDNNDNPNDLNELQDNHGFAVVKTVAGDRTWDWRPNKEAGERWEERGEQSVSLPSTDLDTVLEPGIYYFPDKNILGDYTFVIEQIHYKLEYFAFGARTNLSFVRNSQYTNEAGDIMLRQEIFLVYDDERLVKLDRVWNETNSAWSLPVIHRAYDADNEDNIIGFIKGSDGKFYAVCKAVYPFTLIESNSDEPSKAIVSINSATGIIKSEAIVELDRGAVISEFYYNEISGEDITAEVFVSIPNENAQSVHISAYTYNITQGSITPIFKDKSGKLYVEYIKDFSGAK